MADHKAKQRTTERRGPDRRKKDVEVEVDQRKPVDRRSTKDRRQKP